MKKFGGFLLMIGLIWVLGACSQPNSPDKPASQTSVASKRGSQEMMRLMINGTEIEVTLEKNPTTKKLTAILPAEFMMQDLHHNEKYYDLPQSLPINAKTIGKIEAGDVLLYGENTLVIFYKSFETGYSYTRIGRITTIGNLADQLGKGEVTVNRINAEREE